MEPKTAALIAKMEKSRSRLNAALDKVAPQAEIYPTWKVKQVLDHITGWDELVSTTLRAYQRGETPARVVKSIDRYNADSISVRQAATLEQSRQAYDAARQEMLDILRSLSPEVLSQKYKAPWGGMCTITSIVKIFISHESNHARHIEELLNKPG